jgi:hypothetical protein
MYSPQKSDDDHEQGDNSQREVEVGENRQAVEHVKNDLADKTHVTRQQDGNQPECEAAPQFEKQEVDLRERFKSSRIRLGNGHIHPNLSD